MIVQSFSGKFMRFTSHRTGEVMVEIACENGKLEVKGTSPQHLLKLEMRGDDLDIAGTIRDRVGDAFRLHDDGREEHLANVIVNVGPLEEKDA